METGRPDLYVLQHVERPPGQRVAARSNFHKPPKAYRRHAKRQTRCFRKQGRRDLRGHGRIPKGVEMGPMGPGRPAASISINDGKHPRSSFAAGPCSPTPPRLISRVFFSGAKGGGSIARNPRSPEPAYENVWNALGQAVHEKVSFRGPASRTSFYGPPRRPFTTISLGVERSRL